MAPTAGGKAGKTGNGVGVRRGRGSLRRAVSQTSASVADRAIEVLSKLLSISLVREAHRSTSRSLCRFEFAVRMI